MMKTSIHYIYTHTREAMGCRWLCLLLACCFMTCLQAQRVFRIYDATGSVDTRNNKIQLVDNDNGKPMSELGLELNPLTGDVKVYVTELARGQRLIKALMQNTTRDITEFYTYHENHPRFVLRPASDGTYEVTDRIYNDLIGSDLCIIVRKEGMHPELFPMSIIDDYEDEGACPLYYTNRLKIQMTEKRMERQIHFESATLQLGDELIFPELLKVKGHDSQRLVIERTIEMCTFDLDYNLLTTRQRGNNPGIHQLRSLLSHPELGAGDKWHVAPSVFVGKKFGKRLERRMAGNVMRDSMMLFSEDHELNDELYEQAGSVRWRMPNIDRYYRLRHSYYLQNFQQADSTSEACTCTRVNPLRYFDLPDNIAPHDSIKELQKYYDQLPFSQHRKAAQELASTNLINYYVVNMAIGHEKLLETGKYTDPMVREAFTACHDSLQALRDLVDCDMSAQRYFEILTMIRYADMTLPTDRPEQLIAARDLLTQLFISNTDMIAACQGDRYLREIYRNTDMRDQHMDIYLEAVEEYIKWWTNNQ